VIFNFIINVYNQGFNVTNATTLSDKSNI